MEKNKISRRTFLKNAGIALGGAAAGTGLLGLSACAGGPAAGTALSRGAQFEPETLGLCPGGDPAEINFTWYAGGGAGGASFVRLFDEWGRLLQTARGTAEGASSGKLSHKVTAGGLKPDTRYRYAVSNDGVNWSYEYGFKTAGADRFSFACVGDPQLTRGEQDKTSRLFSIDKSTAQGWKDTLGKIAAAGVDFIAGVGDQVDKTGRGDEVEYRNFFAPPNCGPSPSPRRWETMTGIIPSSTITISPTSSGLIPS